MKSKIVLLLLIGLLLFLLPNSSVLADMPSAPHAVNYCTDPVDEERCLTLFDGFGAFLSETGTTLAVSTIAAIDMLVWFVDRLVLAVYDAAVNGAWLETFRGDLLDNLANFLPDTLRQITLGPTGIMYIALALAGVLMTIPLYFSGTGSKLVRPERVLVWGVVITALFISGTIGYDLIGGIESLRVDIVRNMMGGEDTQDSAETLVLTPMLASHAEADLIFDNLNQLPGQFMEAYFPPVQKIEVSVKTIESGWFGAINTEVESQDSKLARIRGASQSLLYGLISLGAAIVVILFAIAFIFLGVAALILVLFLMAALPLGFFEFGNMILMSIMERYIQIVAFSLALALLMRVSGGLMAALPTGVTTPTAAVEWMILLGALFMSIQILFTAAFKALTASFSAFTTSVKASLGAQTDGPGVTATVGRALTGAAMGAMALGGAGGAVLGGASALLGMSPAVVGRGASTSTSRNQSNGVGDVFVGNGAVPVVDGSLVDEEYVSRGDASVFAPDQAEPIVIEPAETQSSETPRQTDQTTQPKTVQTARAGSVQPVLNIAQTLTPDENVVPPAPAKKRESKAPTTQQSLSTSNNPQKDQASRSVRASKVISPDGP